MTSLFTPANLAAREPGELYQRGTMNVQATLAIESGATSFEKHALRKIFTVNFMVTVVFLTGSKTGGQPCT